MTNLGLQVPVLDAAGNDQAKAGLWDDISADLVPRDVLKVHGVNSILPAFMKVR